MKDEGVDIYLSDNAINSGRAGTISNTSFIIPHKIWQRA
jgi:hypothetical protein